MSKLDELVNQCNSLKKDLINKKFQILNEKKSVEFTQEQALEAGAFLEEALTEQDAMESNN